jgi:hypothetical protein
MFKSHLIQSNHRVPRKNEVDTYGVPVFAPDYSTTVLSARMCTMSILCILLYFIEHSAHTSIVCTLILQ